MMSRTALSLLFLTVATPVLAQSGEALPTRSPEVATAAPAPSPPPPVVELRDPRVMTSDALPREQVFISPSGEPFRAPLNQAYPMATWFAAADTNRDGALVPDEFFADHLRFFDRLDANKDGVIDGFEAGDYEKTVAPEVTFDPSAPTARRKGFFRRRSTEAYGTDLQGAAYYGVVNEPLPVRAADADLDYKITRAETLAAASRRFALLDVDGDGRIALAELPPTRAQQRAGKSKN